MRPAALVSASWGSAAEEGVDPHSRDQGHIAVEVDQHPRYRREGADLYCSVPVGMVQAAMGGHVEVETPEGRVTIEVPAGTQTGQRFRLRKRGVPRLDGGGRGDLWAIAEVVIPAVTDDRGRSLLRELSQVLPEG